MKKIFLTFIFLLSFLVLLFFKAQTSQISAGWYWDPCVSTEWSNCASLETVWDSCASTEWYWDSCASTEWSNCASLETVWDSCASTEWYWNSCASTTTEIVCDYVCDPGPYGSCYWTNCREETTCVGGWDTRCVGDWVTQCVGGDICVGGWDTRCVGDWVTQCVGGNICVGDWQCTPDPTSCGGFSGCSVTCGGGTQSQECTDTCSTWTNTQSCNTQLCIYCGNGLCDGDENPVECPSDCPPPGYESGCTTGTCANGTPWETYCTPSCSDPNRSCYDSPSCEERDCRKPGVGCPPTGGGCGAGGGVCAGESVCGEGGNCYTDCSGCPIPQHNECQGTQCVTVEGEGVNTCGTNDDCSPLYHSECSGRNCVVVIGAGENQCASDTDCSPLDHLECVGNRCAVVAGYGSDTCDSDPQCGDPYHNECQNYRCVSVSGAGDDECSGNAGCTPPPLPPTCSSVSLSPDPMVLFEGQTTATTLTGTVNDLRDGGVVNTTFSSNDTNVATVTTPDSSSPYQSTATPLNRGSTTVNATANLSGAGGTGSCTGTGTVNVGGCSVSLSASSVTNPNPVTVSYTGRSPNSGTEPVRLWLERQDGQAIIPPPPNQGVWPGAVTYYQLASGNSVNGSTVNGSVTLQDLPAGDYYVHCDIPNDPNKCTGNPWGVGAGWESCSTTDNAALTFNDPPPFCTGVSPVTLAPDPMPLFPEQLTGRTLTPTVSGIRYGSISSVSYSSSAPGVATVTTPSSVSPFQSTVGTPGTRGSATVTATANLSGLGGTGSCTGTGTVNVGGCTVSLSAPSVLNTGSVTANYTGRSPDTVTEPVRLWLERQDGQAIIPPPPNQGVWPGAVTYYQLASGNSVNGSTVNGSVTLQDLPAGDYYVHCDIPNDPNKCTGNPWGVGAGWESCSTSDNAPLTVIGVPTCSINGPPIIYLGETSTPPFTASATIQGVVYPGDGIANVEIDRNISQSVSGPDFVQMRKTTCGNTLSTCTIPYPPDGSLTWTPQLADVDKTFYVFCQGYNVTPDPDIQCRPFGLYDSIVVGDCGPSDIKTVEVKPPPPWFQTRGGDIHSNGLLYSRIPVNASPPYFSVAQDLFPGLVSAGSYDFGPLGASAVSQTPPFGWLVSSPSPPPYTYGGTKYDYAKFYGNVGSLMTGTINTKTPNQALLNSLNGYYLVDDAITGGDLIINDDGNPWTMGGGGNDGRQLVIFVPGDLRINSDIKIRNSEPNFLAFIVKGNILIDGSVKANNLNNPNLEGVFITDGQFKTGISDNQLYLKGSVVAWGGIALERTYESRSIPPDTAELFEYNIDLLMNAPSLLTPRKLIWQEVGV